MAQILRLRTTAFVIFFLLSLPPGRALAIEDLAVEQQISSVPPGTVDPNGAVAVSPGTFADDSSQTALPIAKPDAPREGDSIWLEEKIAPSTRWIENLVKPVTVWMERKIQRDRPESNAPQKTPNIEPAAGETVIAGPGSDTVSTRAQLEIISGAQASAIAQAHTPGNILRVKLLERENEQPKYRVKLISTSGEIHIIHIDAVTRELIAPQTSNEKP